MGLDQGQERPASDSGCELMAIRCCPNCGTVTKPLNVLAREAGMNYGTLRNRLAQGMSLSQALSMKRMPQNGPHRKARNET